MAWAWYSLLQVNGGINPRANTPTNIRTRNQTKPVKAGSAAFFLHKARGKTPFSLVFTLTNSDYSMRLGSKLATAKS